MEFVCLLLFCALFSSSFFFFEYDVVQTKNSLWKRYTTPMCKDFGGGVFFYVFFFFFFFFYYNFTQQHQQRGQKKEEEEDSFLLKAEGRGSKFFSFFFFAGRKWEDFGDDFIIFEREETKERERRDSTFDAREEKIHKKKANTTALSLFFWRERFIYAQKFKSRHICTRAPAPPA